MKIIERINKSITFEIIMTLLSVVVTTVVYGLYKTQQFSGLVLAALLLLGSVFACIALTIFIQNPSWIPTLAVCAMWFDAFEVAELITVVIFLTLLYNYFFKGWRPVVFAPRAWICSTLFVGWAIISGLWADNPKVWLYGCLQMGLAVAYFIVIPFFISELSDLRKVMISFVWVGLPVSLISLYTYIFFQKRSVGFSGNDANIYAFFAVVAIMICTFLGVESFVKKIKTTYFLLAFVYIAGVFVSGSRSALVTLIVGMTLFAFTYPTKRLKTKLGAISLWATCSFISIFIFAFANPDRFSVDGFLSDRGAGRLDIWSASFDSLKNHLLGGYGFGNFARVLLNLLVEKTGLPSESFITGGAVQTHNHLLGVLLDLGLIGLAIWLIGFAATVLNLWHGMKLVDKKWFWFFLVLLAVWFTNSMFLTQYNNKVQWIIFGVSLLPFGRKISLNNSTFFQKYRYKPSLKVLIASVSIPLFLVSLVFGYSSFFEKKNFATEGNIVVIEPDRSNSFQVLPLNSQVQTIYQIAKSTAFARTLYQTLSSDESFADFRSRLDVSRPVLSATVTITYEAKNKTDAEQVSYVLIDTFEKTYEKLYSNLVSQDNGVLNEQLKPSLGYQKLFREAQVIELGNNILFRCLVLVASSYYFLAVLWIYRSCRKTIQRELTSNMKEFEPNLIIGSNRIAPNAFAEELQKYQFVVLIVENSYRKTAMKKLDESLKAINHLKNYRLAVVKNSYHKSYFDRKEKTSESIVWTININPDQDIKPQLNSVFSSEGSRKVILIIDSIEIPFESIINEADKVFALTLEGYTNINNVLELANLSMNYFGSRNKKIGILTQLV